MDSGLAIGLFSIRPTISNPEQLDSEPSGGFPAQTVLWTNAFGARAIVGGDFHARLDRPLELSPGRHDLVLLREDGTGVRCELDLAPGVERRIAWH